VTADDVLEKGEQFDIVAAPTGAIMKNDQFQLEVKPAIGAALSVSRTAPASILAVNTLY